MTAASLGARQLAFEALRQIDRQDAYANIALDRILRQGIAPLERHLATELVYGTTRRRRTLDALIGQLCPRPADQQPPELRCILRLGLYQLGYLDQIPPAAAIHSSVELAHRHRLGSLAGVVNGALRSYLRRCQGRGSLEPDLDLLGLGAADPVAQLATLHSYPDWLVGLWCDQLGPGEAESLCRWFNRPPTIDLRVNRQRTDPTTLQAALEQAGIRVAAVDGIRDALRLVEHVGEIGRLPGYEQGWWTVQDASAQQVVDWLDPQPGERVIDCCAAPGGKTTHIAERIQDRGEVWALDRHAGRLRRVEQNAERLGLSCIRTRAVDLSDASWDPGPLGLPAWECADRVLLDAPCSGLGTLHRHADARWHQDPLRIAALVTLQAELLERASRWVRPEGILVYSTCTLHPAENQGQIDHFLARNPLWRCQGPPLQVWPHRQHRDGFFLAKLVRIG